MQLRNRVFAFATGAFLVGLGMLTGVATHSSVAHASPRSAVVDSALAIRNHPMGQFESATGAPVYLGTIVVDNTAGGLTNATTATAFNTTGARLCNKVLLVQNVGTVDARVLPVPASNSTVASVRAAGALFGVPLGAGERGIIYMPDQSLTAGCFLGAISTTAASESIDVWELQ